MRKFYAAQIVLVACLWVSGCGGNDVKDDRPDTVPVKITIEYQGKAISGANVVLSPVNGKAGKAASGLTNEEGVASVRAFTDREGAVPGEYTVMVTKSEAVSENAVPEDSAEYVDPGSAKAKKGGKSQGPKQLLPKKYASASSSPLKLTIGQQTDPLEKKFTLE